VVASDPQEPCTNIHVYLPNLESNLYDINSKKSTTQQTLLAVFITKSSRRHSHRKLTQYYANMTATKTEWHALKPSEQH
jgi:hypothetical protein